MKNFKTLLFILLTGSLLAACDSSSNERSKATGEKVSGAIQKTVGNVTNDDALKSEGKKNELKSDLRSTKEDVKDMVKPE